MFITDLQNTNNNNQHHACAIRHKRNRSTLSRLHDPNLARNPTLELHNPTIPFRPHCKTRLPGSCVVLFAIQSNLFWQDVVILLATFQGICKQCISVVCLIAIAECVWRIMALLRRVNFVAWIMEVVDEQILRAVEEQLGRLQWAGASIHSFVLLCFFFNHGVVL